MKSLLTCTTVVETVCATTVLFSGSFLMVSFGAGEVTPTGSCLSDSLGEEGLELPTT